MIPNKIALFLIPAIPVGAIGGIMAMSGLGFWDTFGFTYSMFVFIYVIAYNLGSKDCRAFIEANKEKKPEVWTTWTEMQKLDAIRDGLLQLSRCGSPGEERQGADETGAKKG
jgi:hypothetical protein